MITEERKRELRRKAVSLKIEFDKRIIPEMVELRKESLEELVNVILELTQPEAPAVVAEMSPRIAKLILQIRDALVLKNWDEAYHCLYQITSPKFDKYSDTLWKDVESLAGEDERGDLEGKG